MNTRFPFKYGIASMTSLPHVFLCVEVDFEGKIVKGISSEGLPPKWFTKNTETTFEEDLPEMITVLTTALEFSKRICAETIFDFWVQLYELQDHWAKEEKVPSLMAHLGTSLVERALIDAFCRAQNKSFHQSLHENILGINLEYFYDELKDSHPSNWLPYKPLNQIIARHTVGLGDPLIGSEISIADRCDDGLPQALDEVIDKYGITHFKIKICGEIETDLPRLEAIATLLKSRIKDFKFTLDGNEQFSSVSEFRIHWEKLKENALLKSFLNDEHLLFVEQPLHRDFALNDAVLHDIAQWDLCPAMIIDESDGELSSLQRALDLGYRGTSHKNCKGVFKGIANACKIQFNREEKGGEWMISGEDLANVGPVALLNDLTVMSSLGIDHVERNGHHYFSGLSMYATDIQKKICLSHGDLYSYEKLDFPSLIIKNGLISLDSLIESGFGFGLELDEENIRQLGVSGMVSENWKS
ncbi:MAG: hypothetical protein CMO38_02705 [Verrucomicrobiaceae bacterium]|nr:hypothetical protein [Verrucomicrobiaceae bacterium]